MCMSLVKGTEERRENNTEARDERRLGHGGARRRAAGLFGLAFGLKTRRFAQFTFEFLDPPVLFIERFPSVAAPNESRFTLPLANVPPVSESVVRDSELISSFPNTNLIGEL